MVFPTHFYWTILLFVCSPPFSNAISSKIPWHARPCSGREQDLASEGSHLSPVVVGCGYGRDGWHQSWSLTCKGAHKSTTTTTV